MRVFVFIYSKMTSPQSSLLLRCPSCWVWLWVLIFMNEAKYASQQPEHWKCLTRRPVLCALWSSRRYRSNQSSLRPWRTPSSPPRPKRCVHLIQLKFHRQLQSVTLLIKPWGGRCLVRATSAASDCQPVNQPAPVWHGNWLQIGSEFIKFSFQLRSCCSCCSLYLCQVWKEWGYLAVKYGYVKIECITQVQPEINYLLIAALYL